jgi:uncharacterized protein (TIGR03086 family)
MDLIELHQRTVDEFLARVAAVGDDQWDRPTPCSEWDVRQLVNHVVGEDRWTQPLLAGRTIADVGSSLDGDLLGDDPPDAARSAAGEATASVAERMPAGGTVHLSYGDEDMGEYVRQLAADHLIHAWDLAAATGGERRLDAELVADVAVWFADREQLYRGAGVIGERGPDVAEGDAQAELLSAFGRDPAWAG